MKYLITKNDILNESISEIFLIRMEMCGLDDDSLVDEVMELSAHVDVYEKIDKIIASYFKKAKLSASERKVLENAYLLFHVEHCTEE